MGQILSQPVVEKHSDEHKDKYLAYGISCMQDGGVYGRCSCYYFEFV